MLFPTSKHGFQFSFFEMMQHILTILFFYSIDLILKRLFRIIMISLNIFGMSINFWQRSCLPFVEIIANISLNESKDEHVYMAILYRIYFIFWSWSLDMVKALHPHTLFQDIDNAKQKRLLLLHSNSPRLKNHPFTTNVDQHKSSPWHGVNSPSYLAISDFNFALWPNHFGLPLFSVLCC